MPAPPPATGGPVGPSATRFYGSQIGGRSVINYSYTDMPWKLLAFDVYYFFRFFWAIPYILLPINKPGSGELDELSPTGANIFCVAIHAVLSALQLAFVMLLLPLAFLLPVWAAVLVVGVFMGLNGLVCDTLLNGKGDTYTSEPEYAPRLEKHAHEQWIFVNGVAVGQHWLQNNLNRLALTFGRPVLGIHNKTRGIVFDVVECLVQRTLGYATKDVRICYGLVKDKLYDPQLSKVVLLLHSQGGIEGSMVLDWLLQELPQDLLSKLEVYTFGSAANHFNNPHRHVDAEKTAEANPASAAVDVTEPRRTSNHAEDASAAAPSPPRSSATSSSPSAPLSLKTASAERRRPQQQQQRSSPLMRETSAPNPSSVSDRAIGHIEHYAHTTDFVALWGVLHFATSAPAQVSMPRFMGRVFARASDRGGHQLCHHYLDGMFPLSQEFGIEQPGGGRFAGRTVEAGPGEGQNSFMYSEVVVGSAGDEESDVKAAFESSWIGVALGDCDDDEGINGNGNGATAPTTTTTVHSQSPILARKGSRRVVRVKDLSRLWQYRDGRSPEDAPQLSPGRDGDGVVRGIVM